MLFAHGDHFTAGLDLADVGPALAAGDARLPGRTAATPGASTARRGPSRWSPPSHGWCMTLGIELLLAADIRIAAADPRFAQLEIQRGIYPFGGATIRLPREAGWGNAMRWLLTGDEFDAAEAHRIGLVQEVVDDAAASWTARVELAADHRRRSRAARRARHAARRAPPVTRASARRPRGCSRRRHAVPEPGRRRGPAVVPRTTPGALSRPLTARRMRQRCSGTGALSIAGSASRGCERHQAT